MTVLYGSTVADATLTNACDMASTSGGVEGGTFTTFAATALTFGEIFSQGGASTPIASIPATPTGHGWVYLPGAGTFATGNWGAVVTVGAGGWGGSSANTDITIRFFKYSGGSYTLIGTINKGITGTAKTTYTFTNTSMSSVAFGASDLLYVDLWWHDSNTNIGGDDPHIYTSTSATQGVANDMQVTTSTFTTTSTRTITSTAALLQTGTRTITSTAALLQTNTRTITSTAALLQTQTRTITSTASLDTGASTSTRTIPSTAALLQTSTRTVTSTAALLQTKTRTITSSAALLQIGTRTVPSTAALLQPGTRTITSTAALLQTNARAISSTAALLQTNKRTIPSSVSLGASRVIPSTAALLQTLSRTIFSSASLASAIVVTPTVNAQLIYLQAAQLITASGNSGPLTVGYLGEISLDINITSSQGTSPTIQFYIERLGTDGVYYPIYDSTSISTAPMVKSASTGAGLGSAASFAGTIRVRWVTGGSSSPGWIYSLSLVGK